MSKNKEKDPSQEGMKKPKPPSIFKMAANFAKDLTKYIKEGAPNVTHDQYVKRLETCKKCPHLMEEKMRCGLCGCLMEHKAKWRTTTCPDKPSRWDAMYLSPEDLAKMEAAKNLIEGEQKEKEILTKQEQHETQLARKKRFKKISDGLNKAVKEGKVTPEQIAKKFNAIIYDTKGKDITEEVRRGEKKHPKEYGESDSGLTDGKKG
tara:strand:- start:5294 stop:5911 length:618 start_codon:yes stop_codon:yes gene_type:complete